MGRVPRQALAPEQVQAIYDRKSPGYDWQHGLLTLHSDDTGRELVVERGVQAGDRVLDAGGGRIDSLLDRYVRPLGATATITGSGMVLKTVMDMIFEGQVYSLATATVLVLLSLCALFRSVRDGLICMIGPFFTGMANFGGMALLGIPLGPEKALISAIALGIGVDYSIHLMSRFRDTVAEGVPVNEAIVEAMRTTGRAILFNALVVIAGFLVLAASASPSNAVFGLMIASNMGISCLAALTLLPAALAVMGYLQQARAERQRGEDAQTEIPAGGLAVGPEDKHA